MSSFVNAIAAISRRYPFLAGGTRISLTAPFRALATLNDAEAWVDVEGGRLLVPVNDMLGRAVFFFGDLDPKIGILVSACVKPGDHVLDIGANIGLVAFKLARQVGPAGKVYAFEPSPRMLQYLEASVNENRYDQIEICSFGLGDHATTATLTVPKNAAGSASMVAPVHDVDYTIDVPVRTLSEWASTEAVDRIDFIKLDVEGFEAEVLKGGLDAIARWQPSYILFEEHGLVFGNEFPLSMTLLIKMGYQIFAVMKSFTKLQLVESTIDAPIARHDYIAVQPDKISAIERFIARGR